MAVDRHFFQSVGAYDPGMLLWGEEQIELSIRVKQTFYFNYQLAIQILSIIPSLTGDGDMTDCFCFHLKSHKLFLTMLRLSDSVAFCQGLRNAALGHDAFCTWTSQVE